MVEEVYEMGSIIKALTMAAGIDSKAVAPSTTYYDAGFIDLNTYTIKNYDGRGRGTVNMQQVLNQSLNTGVAFIVKTMGKDRFRDYFKKLKFIWTRYCAYADCHGARPLCARKWRETHHTALSDKD
jgi:cell division protein FtsI/penicillin-binding protein 2